MKFFEKNIGDMDRLVRMVLAFVLVGVGIFMLTPPLTYVAFLFAVMMAFTGATRSCGAYSLLGISTVAKKADARTKK